MKPIKFGLPESYVLKVIDEDFLEENKTEPAFYTLGNGINLIATVKHESGCGANIYCNGEMRIVVDEDICRSVQDLNRKGIETDENLSEVPEENWQNNSWFESVFFDTQGEENWNDSFSEPSFTPEDAVHDATELIKWCLENK